LDLQKNPAAVAFLAGATLIGTIGIGKAAVDAAHSKVVYPKGKDSTLDESVRLVGAIFGIAVTLFQLPKAWEEAQKLIQSTP
jgi:hypothetical protein